MKKIPGQIQTRNIGMIESYRLDKIARKMKKGWKRGRDELREWRKRLRVHACFLVAVLIFLSLTSCNLIPPSI